MSADFPNSSVTDARPYVLPLTAFTRCPFGRKPNRKGDCTEHCDDLLD